MKVIVVGGGAAGFFTAINLAEKIPSATITMLEQSQKLLSKVKVSGGGRCNVTNGRTLPQELQPFYPRGGKKLYPVFKQFSTREMRSWLSSKGVETKEEDDQRVFPVSNSSQTIIDCFLKLTSQYSIQIKTGEVLTHLKQKNEGWKVQTRTATYVTDCVIIATGSSPKTWHLLSEIGLKLVSPVPSLFTFNISDSRISQLSGVSVEETVVRVVGSKMIETGPLLITHWGLSGPAILKLSSIGALELHQMNYQFEVLINWVGGLQESDIRTHWDAYTKAHPKRLIMKYPLWNLPRRLWESIVTYCEIPDTLSFSDISKKATNKLIEELIQGRYQVNGKSTFKDEFVTAGGVDLSEIDLNDFSCKKYPGLYFAGEVLNIDALTGGFNFQACWSAGWLISEAISKSNT